MNVETAQRKPDVSEALDRLSESVAALEGAVDSLSTRTIRVRRNVSEQPNVKEAALTPPAQACPLARDIKDCADRVFRLGKTVSDITNELEI